MIQVQAAAMLMDLKQLVARIFSNVVNPARTRVFTLDFVKKYQKFMARSLLTGEL